MFTPSNEVRASSKLMLAALEDLVRASLKDRRGGVPSLYKSGVRYAKEARGVDEWLSAKETYARGVGDCEDLAAWLCADLRMQGDKLACVVLKLVKPGLKHALVLDGKGRLRDPSRKLGMGRKDGY